MTNGHISVAEYVAGNLSREEFDSAQSHLESCNRCRVEVESILRQNQRRRFSARLNTIVDFTSHLFLGGIAMLGPPLRRLSTRSVKDIGIPAKSVQYEPLRVMLPQVARGMFGPRGRFVLVIIITLTVLMVPTPPGLTNDGQKALAVFAFTASILALEPVSLPIAALLVPVVQVMLGIAQAPVAFEPFSRPVVFLILSSLFLAEALRKHGLTRRLALITIVASGGGIRNLLLAIMSIAALFAMWVENTATAAMLIPVALTISRQVPDPNKARGLLVMLGLGIGYGASLGGMVTIVGSAASAVASGFLAKIMPWQFIDWMKFGFPLFLLIFPITWFLLSRMVPVEVDKLDVEPSRERLVGLGPISSVEKDMLMVVASAAFLWVTGSFIEKSLGLNPTLLSASIIAILAVAVMAIRKIITWEDVKGVSWGIFFIIGAGLSLGEALTRTGATKWFATLIKPIVIGPPYIVSLLILVYLSALFTNLMNNTTIAAVFAPILISIAQSTPSLNAIQLVLPVTLATTFGYSLPSASGRMALIAATGIVERSEMMKYGTIVSAVSAAILAGFFYFLSIVGWI